MTGEPIPAHWHVASGLSGYGPEGTDSYAVATDPETLADLVRGELDAWAEFESDSATEYASAGDYKSAWKLREHSDAIENLGANLDNSRADAPLYRGDPGKWHESILSTVAANFPHDVNEGRSRVYVWQCENGPECEHLNEEN